VRMESLLNMAESEQEGGGFRLFHSSRKKVTEN